MSKINYIRRLQFFISSILFFSIFIFCYKTTGFDLTEIPLSKWGVTENVKWFWNLSLIIMGVSCFFNISHYIKEHQQLMFKKTLNTLFFIECMSICLIGIFPSGNFLHSLFAYGYFFSLPFTIFCLAFINRNILTPTEWFFHTIISSLMIVFPLMSFLYFEGEAIAEIIHIVIFLVWNIYIK